MQTSKRKSEIIESMVQYGDFPSDVEASKELDEAIAHGSSLDDLYFFWVTNAPVFA